MTRLERCTRRLLLVYPAAYRRERGDEIIATLLEATPDGRSWPRLRDVRALAVSGLKARAAQNRQRTTSANLRVAIMAGLAMYTALWVAGYFVGVVQVLMPDALQTSGWATWPSTVTALLACATVVLAWTAPRIVALVAALASSMAVIAFALVASGPSSLFAPHFLQLLSLVGLAALAPRAGHPSRHWLWLPGLLTISSPLISLGAANGLIGYSLQLQATAVTMLVVAVCGFLWVGIDARLIVATLTCLAVFGLQAPIVEISSGLVDFGWLPFVGVVGGIAAPAVWLLRRQSARPAGMA